jgi:AcrR family transcriptional regulator
MALNAARADAPRRRRLEPDARREQILECAVRLFGERSYEDVSTADIAREAGVARGLLNHYFGTKRELYLDVVRSLVLLPDLETQIEVTGSLRQRVDKSVAWFLDTVGAHGNAFVAVTGSSAIVNDPQLEQILADADDLAARKVLQMVGLPAGRRNDRQRAVVRAYGGLVKVAIKEWVRDRTLSRDEVHLLLSRALIAIVRDVLPNVSVAPVRTRSDRAHDR